LRSVIEEIEDWKHLSFPTGDENGKEKKGSKEADDRDGEDADEAMDEDGNADTSMRDEGEDDEA
jgi:hypothetical protein